MTGTPLAGMVADLYMASGDPVSFSAEAMTDSGDHIIYSITNAAKRYWDDGSAAPTVEVSTDSGSTWTTADPSTYTVQYVGGLVTFGSADGTRSVRVTGHYLAISQVGNAYNWELTQAVDLLDATVFGDTWKESIAAVKSATAKASSYLIDGTFQALLASRFVLILYVDFADDIRFEGYAYLKTPAIKVGVDTTVDQDLEWTFDGPVYSVLS